MSEVTRLKVSDIVGRYMTIQIETGTGQNVYILMPSPGLTKKKKLEVK